MKEKKYFIEWTFKAEIYYWTKTGDARGLANLIRENELPKEIKAKIADILDGTLKHEKGSKSYAKSYPIIKRLCKLFFARNNIHYDSIHELVANGDLPKDRLDGLKKYHLSKKEVTQIIADEFYRGDFETARKIIERLTRNLNLLKIED